MLNNIGKILDENHIGASAPCRIDMGGTLDIGTFYYPLRRLEPCTFNIALDMQTKVTLLPYDDGLVKVTSKGFESAEYPLKTVPFNHPLGLMFAVAAYFEARGVHILIDSSSPPRSALGGSSTAAVALVFAFSKALAATGRGRPYSRRKCATLAHAIEQNVAGVPCGMQDQLAAAFGGVNAWFWQADPDERAYRKKTVVGFSEFAELEKRILVAYCGIPHESKDINGKWVRRFLAGEHRDFWAEIIAYTKVFIDSLADFRLDEAALAMNREVEIRRKMTPEVLDEIGKKLVDTALGENCGARFTGAGGGGCLWALGEERNIGKLRKRWELILAGREGARLLDTKIAAGGCG